jgi:hypothetical protein
MTDADLEELLEVPRESYARAGSSLCGAWPEESSLRGRAHATPIAFSLEDGAFWVATVASMRLRNLRTNPWASLMVTDGQRNGRHPALTAEGPVTLHEGVAFDLVRERLGEGRRTRHGQAPDWAVAYIELRPERILSYRDPDA